MTNEITQKLKIPAIGLIAVGILNILFGLYFLFAAVKVAYSGINYRNFNTEQEKFIFNIGLYGIIALGILSLLVAPVIIYGALKMMRGEKVKSAKIAAILAMIPVTSFWFIFGIPFGIWALMLWSKIKPAGDLPVEMQEQNSE
ncbi:hypothetical protein BH20ACI4_BH20ACI4_23890 [soil metagenome]